MGVRIRDERCIGIVGGCSESGGYPDVTTQDRKWQGTALTIREGGGKVKLIRGLRGRGSTDPSNAAMPVIASSGIVSPA